MKICGHFDDFASSPGLTRSVSHGRWSSRVRRGPPRSLTLVFGRRRRPQPVGESVGFPPVPRADDPKNESNPTAHVSTELKNAH